MLRGGGLFTIPALLGTAGFLLLYAGHMADARRPMLYGWFCLAGAGVLLLGVLWVRWQGWIE
jgi:hypothetical protein